MGRQGSTLRCRHGSLKTRLRLESCFAEGKKDLGDQDIRESEDQEMELKMSNNKNTDYTNDKKTRRPGDGETRRDQDIRRWN